MRIDVIDNFLMPDEVVKYQRKVKELTWNAFERDIFQQDNVLSGMIADLNPDWREEFDDKILTKAQELTNVDLWIGRAYMNAWKANEICLPHRDYNHTNCLVYMNIDVGIQHAGETVFFDDENDAVGIVSPKPGRAVFFDGFKLHRAGSVNSLYMKDYRYTLAYKLHHKDDDKKTTEMVKHNPEETKLNKD